MRLVTLAIGLVLGGFAWGAQQATDTVVWTQNFITWGQGVTTDDAASDATAQTLPLINNLRLTCDTSKGIVSVQAAFGYCAPDNDPMFCEDGCYTCPDYVTAVCEIDTSGTIQSGSLVVATADANLYSGNQQVGKVTGGTQFHVTQIDGSWVSLVAMDGSAQPGWIQLSDLKLVN